MILCVIQARVGSRRLPGKVLKPFDWVPSILWTVRAAQDAGLDPIVAVPLGLANECIGHMVPSWYAGDGDENDVLRRFYGCWQATQSPTSPVEHIVRLTGDCPRLSPSIIRWTVEHHLTSDTPYTFSHWLEPLPKGQEVEVFTRDLLSEAHHHATDPYDREHVTPWMRRQVGDRQAMYTGENLSLDTIEDYHRLAAMEWPPPC